MGQVTVEDLRDNLRELIERVEAGEAIEIVRHGREVARLMPPRIGPAHVPSPPARDGEAAVGEEPPQPESKRFPDLTEFRESIEIRGESPLEALLRLREETRY